MWKCVCGVYMAVGGSVSQSLCHCARWQYSVSLSVCVWRRWQGPRTTGPPGPPPGSPTHRPSTTPVSHLVFLYIVEIKYRWKQNICRIIACNCNSFKFKISPFPSLNFLCNPKIMKYQLLLITTIINFKSWTKETEVQEPSLFCHWPFGPLIINQF